MATVFLFIYPLTVAAVSWRLFDPIGAFTNVTPKYLQA
jgi:hypothetical protein